MSDQKYAVLKYDGNEYKLPVLTPSIGPNVIDIKCLYRDAQIFTYDPGFMSTASCKSSITFIDGQKGILRYRGYDIKELAEKEDFTSVIHLLLQGDLPDKKQKQTLVNKITHHSMIHEQLHFLFRGFTRHSHPMAVMVGAVGALSSFYHDCLDIRNPEHRHAAAHKIIAKIPTLAAMTYRYMEGLPFVYPKNSLSYTENFLYMMFSNPCEEYKVDKVVAGALDKIFILHADHEQNASTSTVRLSSSSGANPFACIASGIACLWGPAHGGANEAVIKMLEEIGGVDNIPKYIAKAKDSKDPFRLMGFGHRVYKNYDPRSVVLKDTCRDLLKHLGRSDEPLLKIALELEKIALEDEYFNERKLYPNVDFYSGIIYRAIGIPTQMYTVLFAIARTVGWISQWEEMMSDPENKIGRPRQLYVGHKSRKLAK